MVPRILLVTGTDTGVGKTVSTAAICAVLRGAGRTVAVYKPCQTGSADGDSDVDEVIRLADPTRASVGIALAAPLAPVIAAELEGADLPDLGSHAERIRALAAECDHVLVEGAGGLLVDLDSAGGTIADLAALLDAPCVLVTRPGLGTLNHTALTVEAMTHRGVGLHGVILGSWPDLPGLAESHNRRILDRGVPALLGAIPDGSGRLEPAAFRAQAPQWLPGIPA